MAQKPDDRPAMLASRTAPVSPARASKFSLFPASSPGSGRTATTDTIPEKSIFRRPYTSTGSSIRSGSGPTKPGEQKHPISVGHRSSESPTASSFLDRHSAKLSTAYHSRSSTEDSFLSCSEFAIGTSGLSRSTTANDSLPPTPSSNAGQESASETKPLRSVVGAPKQATEISVARQISVSTQKRHQLVPIVAKRAHRPSLPRLASVEA